MDNDPILSLARRLRGGFCVRRYRSAHARQLDER
jgi:hypothetical protein